MLFEHWLEFGQECANSFFESMKTTCMVPILANREMEKQIRQYLLGSGAVVVLIGGSVVSATKVIKQITTCKL